MKPGYFFAILITFFFVAEYFWKNKQFSSKEVVIMLIAALAAGVFGGLMVEGWLGLFRLFMQASVQEPTWHKEVYVLVTEVG